MRYEFILRNKDDYTVEKMCECMKVSKNAYYNWLKGKDIPKNPSLKFHLKERIRIVFEESKEIYGSHRIRKALEKEGLNYSRSYIGFLMKEMGLKSVLKRKFVSTTDSNHSFPVARNILDRNFTSAKLGEKWVSDMTYIRVGDDWNYLTTIIDLADRKVVGWSLSEDMTVDNTVYPAWIAARKTRAVREGFIFHSDRGVQYTCCKITSLFPLNCKMIQSMSRKGNCWDNAVAESFFKSIKYEWVYRFKYETHGQLYESIEEYINWYNTKRLHSSLGYRSPLEMEINIRNNFKIAA